MKRKVPYGVMNWEEVVRECYLVDNTAYIRALEDVKTPVFLRPKRFGKSLWCSMLGYYYDVNFKDRFGELFGRTDIGRDPTPLANSFLVLKFDFSTIQVGTVREIERDFFEHVKNCVKSFTTAYAHLSDWSGVWVANNPAALIDKVRAVVKDAGLPPLYVIIDEYDNFTNELVVSRRDAEYDAICGHDADAARESFFKAFFKSFKAGLADGTVGRTYFTGVLPITLDDLSSGFNVGTVVSLDEDKLGIVGFSESQVAKYVEEIFADRGFDRSNYPAVLSDLKAFYDGYRFLPGAEPLYNATICNWYLRCLVVNKGRIPEMPLDANVRTDVGWIRRLAGGTANALARVQAYVERGEGEAASRGGLAAKFGRAKFFTEEFFPYALYYLGLLTFESPFRLGIPNLTIRNMFVDYYDELSEFRNEDEARRHFGRAAEDLALDGGTWRGLFEAYWQHFVKARIPAQAFDKMNENFFRTTFASRTWDYLPMYYSIETEYNTPEGRCDFLAVPKPGFAKPACLVEFKYFTNAEAERQKVLGRATPDAETVAQAKRYRDSLPRRPGWSHPVETYVVEVCGNRGYNWFCV
ncbi:MAG: AAA family ATPase [Verrucomicrobiota bacterium]|nr:AAA family ATPase [Verrucomicrobiota bacterium]MDY5597633.1 AAA family ATPase [Kiritimatiellia bacterium]